MSGKGDSVNDSIYLYSVYRDSKHLTMQSSLPCDCETPGQRLKHLLNNDFPDESTGYHYCDRCDGIAENPGDEGWV